MVFGCFKDVEEMTGSGAGIVPVAAVESRLAATRLPTREIDFDALITKHLYGCLANFGEEEIDKAGYEKRGFQLLLPSSSKSTTAGATSVIF